MAVENNVPVGGIIAMTGTETVPDNFLCLDGSRVDEPRSPLNGEILPNWHSDDYDYVPVQDSTGNGDTYRVSGRNVRLSDDYLPDNVKIAYYITKRATGSGTANSETDETTFTLGSKNTFSTSVLYANSYISFDGMDDVSGSGRAFLKVDGTSGYDTQNSNHTHSGTWYHGDAHDITYTSSSSGIGTYPFGLIPTSPDDDYTISTNGKSVPDYTFFPKRRKVMLTKWYMRIF